MAKKFYIADDDKSRLYFFCPGCECDHMIQIEGAKSGPVWKFDNNYERPTITPSIRTFDPNTNKTICHFYINGGQIQYLNDCVHRYAGQSVEMKDIDSFADLND